MASVTRRVRRDTFGVSRGAMLPAVEQCASRPLSGLIAAATAAAAWIMLSSETPR